MRLCFAALFAIFGMCWSQPLSGGPVGHPPPDNRLTGGPRRTAEFTAAQINDMIDGMNFRGRHYNYQGQEVPASDPNRLFMEQLIDLQKQIRAIGGPRRTAEFTEAQINAMIDGMNLRGLHYNYQGQEVPGTNPNKLSMKQLIDLRNQIRAQGGPRRTAEFTEAQINAMIDGMNLRGRHYNYQGQEVPVTDPNRLSMEQLIDLRNQIRAQAGGMTTARFSEAQIRSMIVGWDAGKRYNYQGEEVPASHPQILSLGNLNQLLSQITVPATFTGDQLRAMIDGIQNAGKHYNYQGQEVAAAYPQKLTLAELNRQLSQISPKGPMQMASFTVAQLRAMIAGMETAGKFYDHQGLETAATDPGRMTLLQLNNRLNQILARAPVNIADMTKADIKKMIASLEQGQVLDFQGMNLEQLHNLLNQITSKENMSGPTRTAEFTLAQIESMIDGMQNRGLFYDFGGNQVPATHGQKLTAGQLGDLRRQLQQLESMSKPATTAEFTLAQIESMIDGMQNRGLFYDFGGNQVPATHRQKLTAGQLDDLKRRLTQQGAVEVVFTLADVQRMIDGINNRGEVYNYQGQIAQPGDRTLTLNELNNFLGQLSATGVVETAEFTLDDVLRMIAGTKSNIRYNYQGKVAQPNEPALTPEQLEQLRKQLQPPPMEPAAPVLTDPGIAENVLEVLPGSRAGGAMPGAGPGDIVDLTGPIGIPGAAATVDIGTRTETGQPDSGIVPGGAASRSVGSGTSADAGAPGVDIGAPVIDFGGLDIGAPTGAGASILDIGGPGGTGAFEMGTGGPAGAGAPGIDFGAPGGAGTFEMGTGGPDGGAGAPGIDFGVPGGAGTFEMGTGGPDGGAGAPGIDFGAPGGAGTFEMGTGGPDGGAGAPGIDFGAPGGAGAIEMGTGGPDGGAGAPGIDFGAPGGTGTFEMGTGGPGGGAGAPGIDFGAPGGAGTFEIGTGGPGGGAGAPGIDFGAPGGAGASVTDIGGAGGAVPSGIDFGAPGGAGTIEMGTGGPDGGAGAPGIDFGAPGGAGTFEMGTGGPDGGAGAPVIDFGAPGAAGTFEMGTGGPAGGAGAPGIDFGAPGGAGTFEMGTGGPAGGAGAPGIDFGAPGGTGASVTDIGGAGGAGAPGIDFGVPDGAGTFEMGTGGAGGAGAPGIDFGAPGGAGTFEMGTGGAGGAGAPGIDFGASGGAGTFEMGTGGAGGAGAPGIDFGAPGGAGAFEMGTGGAGDAGASVIDIGAPGDAGASGINIEGPGGAGASGIGAGSVDAGNKFGIGGPDAATNLLDNILTGRTPSGLDTNNVVDLNPVAAGDAGTGGARTASISFTGQGGAGGTGGGAGSMTGRGTGSMAGGGAGRMTGGGAGSMAGGGGAGSMAGGGGAGSMAGGGAGSMTGGGAGSMAGGGAGSITRGGKGAGTVSLSFPGQGTGGGAGTMTGGAGKVTGGGAGSVAGGGTGTASISFPGQGAIDMFNPNIIDSSNFFTDSQKTMDGMTAPAIEGPFAKDGSFIGVVGEEWRKARVDPAVCRLWQCTGPICYLPYEKDCKNYVVCQRTAIGTYVAWKMRCAFGSYWREGSAWTCERVEDLLQAGYTCPNDPCRDGILTKYADEDIKNCRTYWKCVNGISTPVCCPAGSKFHRKRLECVQDFQETCRAPCPLKIEGCSVPGERTQPFYDGNCRTYWDCENGHPHPVCCKAGMYYNVNTKDCDVDVKSKCKHDCPLEYATNACGMRVGNATVTSYPLYDGNCRTHMQCNSDGFDEAVCCKQGYMYRNDLKRCLPVEDPLDVCSEEVCPTGYKEECRFSTVPGFPNKFQDKKINIEFDCAPGTYFNVQVCTCIFASGQESAETCNEREIWVKFDHPKEVWSIKNHGSYGTVSPFGSLVKNSTRDGITYAMFNGESGLVMWPYTQTVFPAVHMRMNFQPVSGGGERQVMISNCRSSAGKTPSFVVTLNPATNLIEFRGKTATDETVLTIPYDKGAWNQFSLLFDGTNVLIMNENAAGTGETFSASSPLNGAILASEKSLRYGPCKDDMPGDNGFTGFISEVVFAKCLRRETKQFIDNTIANMPIGPATGPARGHP